MRILSCSILALVGSANLCFAQDSATSSEKGVPTRTQLASYSETDTILTPSGYQNTLLMGQFPSDLIPAVQVNGSADLAINLASIPTSDLALNSDVNNTPVEPAEEPAIIVNGPRLPRPAPEQDSPEVRLLKVRREVSRLEIAYHVLSIADAVATISCISANTCRELNPLMGSHPSALRVIGLKALTGFFIHRSIRRLARKDPYRARNTLRIAVGFQAAITGFTLSSSF